MTKPKSLILILMFLLILDTASATIEIKIIQYDPESEAARLQISNAGEEDYNDVFIKINNMPEEKVVSLLRPKTAVIISKILSPGTHVVTVTTKEGKVFAKELNFAKSAKLFEEEIKKETEERLKREEELRKQAEEKEQQRQQPAVPEEPPEKEKKSNIIPILTAVILLLILGILLYFIIKKRKARPKKTAPGKIKRILERIKNIKLKPARQAIKQIWPIPKQLKPQIRQFVFPLKPIKPAAEQPPPKQFMQSKPAIKQEAQFQKTPVMPEIKNSLGKLAELKKGQKEAKKDIFEKLGDIKKQERDIFKEISAIQKPAIKAKPKSNSFAKLNQLRKRQKNAYNKLEELEKQRKNLMSKLLDNGKSQDIFAKLAKIK